MRINQGFYLRLQIVFIFGVTWIAPPPSFASLSSLDFGWGAPIFIKEAGQKQLIAWPIQITNPTKKPWFAKLDVVAVTDTGRQYNAISDTRIESLGGMTPLSLLKGPIFPSVTRRTIALFEEVDPKATLIHFYVGGIIDNKQNKSGDHDQNGSSEIRYFRITYQRTLDGWLWDGSNTLE